MVKNSKASNAFQLGLLCSVSYLAVYIARNVLSVVSPEMIKSGNFTTEIIGVFSTVNMICYACGQLVNGVMGDHIKAKYMINFGLIFSGICNFILPYAKEFWLIAAVYGASGFFLSMIYGPMTRVVSESVAPEYAPRCAMGYTVASFLGSPGAGLLAIMFHWETAFVICGILQILMGVVCFIFFLVLEKKGKVKYSNRNYEITEQKGIGTLLKFRIIRYSLVSMLTGVIRTTVVFWVPTYLTEYLSFSTNSSVTIFSVITVFMSIAPFACLIVYEKLLKRKMNLSVLISFAAGALAFGMMFLVKQPIMNTVFLGLALFANGSAATTLWSIYCPSLKDSGMVSGATGYLDFISYMTAAGANLLFANFVDTIGWGNLILIWAALMLTGFIAFITVCGKKNNI